MDTISDQVGAVRRRRRKHSDEFKAQAVAVCRQPGVSMASVAMAQGVNANLLRRWVVAAEQAGTGPNVMLPSVPRAVPPASFVPLQVAPAPADATPDIRIELRRSATSINVTWPTSAASACAAWMRELLR